MSKYIDWWIVGLVLFAAMDLSAAPGDHTGKIYAANLEVSTSPTSTLPSSFSANAATSSTSGATSSNLINQTDGGDVNIKTKTPNGATVPGPITIESGAGGAAGIGTNASSVTIRARNATTPLGVDGRILLQTLSGGNSGGDVEIRMAQPVAFFGVGNGTQMSSITPRGYGIWQQLRVVVDSYTIADNGLPFTAAAFTLDTSSSSANLACNDTDGCTITMGKTNASDGQVLCITNTTSNASTVTDTAGTAELSGNAVLGIWDTLCLLYSNSRWIQTSKSDN